MGKVHKPNDSHCYRQNPLEYTVLFVHMQFSLFQPYCGYRVKSLDTVLKLFFFKIKNQIKIPRYRPVWSYKIYMFSYLLLALCFFSITSLNFVYYIFSYQGSFSVFILNISLFASSTASCVFIQTFLTLPAILFNLLFMRNS
jgi:hypothetical protein